MKFFALTIAMLCCAGLCAQEDATYQVGFAKVDITPDYPIRLNGFGFRREESAGVSQSLFARAMAISQRGAAPLVVVAIDNLGVRSTQVDEVARRLKQSHQLPRENVVVTFTHTHCGPKVSGACDNIFSEAIPTEHQEHIDRYTSELIDGITRSAQQAIDSRQPSTLGWSIGEVGFAKNRRPMGGPVDHDLPTLIVRDSDSKAIRGAYVSYACHCVTLRFNKLSGDWAGYAAESIERQFPGAVALVSIGAGSGQNPTEVSPEDIQVAQRQGNEIASEVKRLSEMNQQVVTGKPQANLNRIALPLNDLPTRQQLIETSQNGRRPTDRYNASTQLQKLERGEELIKAIDYPIQTWTFGDSLCITFLAGEVCVDYSLRLKQELDAKRFWLVTYSNDFCSYIPSERLVKEGGYGGGAEVPYFALPTTLAAGLEKRIIDEVHRQVPRQFAIPEGVQGIAPKSPEDSLNCMRTHDDLKISLAASEPLVSDPVAIDFGLDGCLWVAEMPDYGRGVYEQFTHTGRIRCLRDQDGDGVFDTATTFVDGLRFPTDVKVWRDGLLICDAPQILHARDTDNDGKADQVESLFSGFEVRNAQARVNSLRWGLDNWVYGSCGLFGGEITSHKMGETTSLVGRDFRMNPDTGEIQPVSGRTQQGRCQNDWGDWFGCSNGTLLRHYSDDDQYARRNPFVAASSSSGLKSSADAHRLYPPANLVRFELSGAPGAATSACGLGIYRDVALGEEYQGSAFTCEPVQQLVHRIKLTQDEVAYRAERGEGESQTEFLTSTDQWFRPVQARTGPDGALWIVDMYRFVIEHPRWLPQSTLAELDVFAGQRHGRIYRVAPIDPKQDQSAIPNLAAMSNDQLAELLTSTNGTLRDLAHQSLIWRKARDVVESITCIVKDDSLPQAKIHAMAVLDEFGSLTSETLLTALQDEDDEVIRSAVRMSDSILGDSADIRTSVLILAAHPNARVRRQVAWSLGATVHKDAVPALATLASTTEPIAQVRSAALSSLHANNAHLVLSHYLELPPAQQVPAILRQIIKSAIRMGEIQEIEPSIRQIVDDQTSFALLTEALDAADARVGDADIAFGSTVRMGVQQIHQQALDDLSPQSLVLLGRYRGKATRAMLESEQASATSTALVMEAIASLLSARQSVETQKAAVAALARTRHTGVGSLLLNRYRDVNLQARSAILDVLLSRTEWTAALIDSIEVGDLVPTALDTDRRAKLLSHADNAVRKRAANLLNSQGSPSRIAVVESYRPSLALQGDVQRGRAHFRKHCSACHQLDGHGHVVGPDLRGLTNRNPEWLLTSILDPNRDVDARYVSWSALLESGSIVSGLVVDETTSMIRLREAGGKEHELLRVEMEQFRANDLSLMPEGLEKELTQQDMSDLIAYVISAIGPTASPARPESLPRRPPEIAPFLLDDSQPLELRQQVIDQRPGMGPAIIGLLVKNLNSGDLETQYQRMPWIWRVALAVGKRNDGGETRDLLELSLPDSSKSLEHWQAVVVGGGVINGLTQIGRWPQRRVAEILEGTPSFQPRWKQTLNQAAVMADDQEVRSGTRYDALRIVALADSSQAIPHLKRYLIAATDRQLQMGAASGLADIESPVVAELLIESLSFLNSRNRHLAIEGLLRTTERTDALLQAIHNNPKLIVASDIEPLLDHQKATTSANAARLLQSLTVSAND